LGRYSRFGGENTTQGTSQSPQIFIIADQIHHKGTLIIFAGINIIPIVPIASPLNKIEGIIISSG
jgi:hypothetical protein